MCKVSNLGKSDAWLDMVKKIQVLIRNSNETVYWASKRFTNSKNYLEEHLSRCFNYLLKY